MTGPFLALLLAVTDGDTFRARLEVWPGVEVVTAVRLRGIDTPEIKGKCPAEKAAAQARLAEIPTTPDDKTLLEWARTNYPMTNYAVEKEELAKTVTVADTVLAVK